MKQDLNAMVFLIIYQIVVCINLTFEIYVLHSSFFVVFDRLMLKTTKQ